MGNTDSIPVVSQFKSFVQFASGDSAGALVTQQNFAYNNTFPIISQIASAGYAIGGDNERALNLQKKFADDMQNVIDSIPVAGHIKGGVHYALGQNAEGDDAMKAASRSTGVVLGGVGGFAVGGPVGAMAGGIAGGAAMDGIITGSEQLINGEHKPYGYVAAGHEIIKAIDGQKKITAEEGFDMGMLPVSDGLAGYSAGRVIGKPLGLDVRGSKPFPAPVRGGYRPPVNAGGGGAAMVAAEESSGVLNKFKVVASAVDDNGNNVAGRGNYMGLDQKALVNRANQLNPNHKPSGPGRPAGYQGIATKLDLDNHANQLNPNNIAYAVSRGGEAPPVQPLVIG